MIDTRLQLISASISDRGLSDKRPQNEDSVLEMADRGIFAVADGVGGAQAGEIASQMAVEILAEAFANKPAGADAEDVMRHAIGRANEAIYQMSSELPQLARMATTVAALHIDGDVATIGHVGDSRVYRLDNKGQFSQETDDHSIVAEEVRAGRMTPEEAANHPSRNIISRALGAEPSVEADIKLLLIEPGTTFLLCSDGITRHIEDEELREYLFGLDDPNETCDRLKQLCYERGAEDNLTAVIVHIPGERSGLDMTPDSDFVFDPDDEDTIATARHHVPEENQFTEPGMETDGAFGTVDENVFDLGEPATRKLTEPDESDHVRSETSVAENKATALPVSHILNESVDVSSSLATHGEKMSSFPSSRRLNVVVPVLTLLLGLGIGFGGFYYWRAANPSQPQFIPVLTEKSENLPLTSFEESRRIVDRDPAAYVNAKVADPRDAADFYLLGRAYLLTGKIWDAKRAFTEARSRLGDADVADKKTLAMEIALGMSIANSVSAPGLLEKELAIDPATIASPDNAANSAVANQTP
jgi:protein phosphatase